MNAPLFFDALPADDASAPERYDVDWLEGRADRWTRFDAHGTPSETWKVEYNPLGQRSLLRHYESKGTEDWQLSFDWTSDDEVRVTKRGADGTSVEVEPGCMSVSARYTADGVQERHCLTLAQEPATYRAETAGALVASRRMRANPATGNLLERTNLGQDGAVVSREEYELDANECHVAIRTYNNDDRLLESSTYVVDRYCRHRSGEVARPNALGYRYESDENGCMVARRYRTADGKPAIDPEFGVGVVKWTRNEYCHALSQAYEEVDGAPAEIGTPKVHLVRWTRDAAGRVLSQSIFDQKREAAADAKGVHTTEWQYDTNGCVTQSAIYDSKRQAAKDFSGVHITRFLRDGRCNPLLEAYYDSKGKPTKGFLQADQIKGEFDSSGRATATRYLDGAGRPTRATGSSIYGLDTGYDAAGQLTSMQYVDKSGEPMRALGGYDRREWSYLPSGEVQHRYLAKGTPVSVRSGHQFTGQAGENISKAAGRTSACDFVGADGAPVDATFAKIPVAGVGSIDAGRVHRIEFRYDAAGRLDQQAFFVGVSALPSRVVSCSEFPCVDDGCLNFVDRR